MKDINKYITELLYEKTKSSSYDTDRMKKGINDYIEDNGLGLINEKYNDAIVRDVIRTNIEALLNLYGEKVTQYFLNYQLIQTLRMLDNKSFKLAKQYLKDKTADLQSSARDIEKELNDVIKQIDMNSDLWNMVHPVVSEIILNIDCIIKNNSQYGFRINNERINNGNNPNL